MAGTQCPYNPLKLQKVYFLRKRYENMKFLTLLFIFIPYLFANTLQEAINNAKPYSTLKLSSGIYRGNIIINKPLTIIAKDGEVIIQGDGDKSVIKINSSYVFLKNLTVTNSGSTMGNIPAAISIHKALHVEIDRCKIIDCLYGIDMNMVSDSKITNNYITSIKEDIAFRGDALKLYYAHNNLFVNNTIKNVRDVTLNYSNNNKFISNTFLNNRFATHISLSHKNSLISNIYKYNSVSIMVMGAKDMNVSKNTILSSRGAAGIGLVIKGISNFVFEYNKLSFNAKGIYIDGQEKTKGMKRYINHNEISYNGEALHFHVSIRDNTITHNKIIGNIDDIVKDIAGEFDTSNIVKYNYWDRYTGFDINKDNIGDTSHKVYQYADQLWHYNNKVKFFYGSPIMSLLNFMSNLAPFVKPNLLIKDTKPIFN